VGAPVLQATVSRVVKHVDSKRKAKPILGDSKREGGIQDPKYCGSVAELVGKIHGECYG
jgi:hypothetical protein